MVDTVSSFKEDPAEAELLHNLGKSLSAVLDLAELPTKIIDAAITLTRANEAAILLPDPVTGHLTLQAVRVPNQPASHEMNQTWDDFLASYVVSRGKPILLQPGDTLPPPNAHRTVGRWVLYVPLTSNGRAIGALGVMSPPQDEPFTGSTQGLLADLGSYAGVAIENARRYEEAVERSKELSLLVESGNALSWSLDLGKVLNAIARQMTRSLQAHWCIISSWGPDSKSITTLAEYRAAVWPGGLEPRIPVGQWPTYRKALSTGTYLSVVDNDPLLRERGSGRLMIIPLQHEGKVIGLAELGCLHATAPYTPEEFRRALRYVLPMGPIVSDPPLGSDYTELITAARILIDATDVNWCTVYRLDSQADTLIRMLDYGAGVWVEQSGPTLGVADLPTPNVVLNEQRIAILSSSGPNLSPSEEVLFNNVYRGTLLLLPLVFKARTVGLVQVYDVFPGREFSSRELGLAHALANQAAIALENAHLVRDLQRSLEEQQAMQSHLVRAARLSAVGELAMVIAHQINNPLTTILGDAEILVQDTQPDSPLHESADAIRRAGERAKRVVERILTMGRQEADPVPVDVNTTILETLELVGGPIRHERINIDLRLTSNLPRVTVVPGNLEDVWMNLLINARDAIMESRSGQGNIVITSRLDDTSSMVEVSVEDNGAGIALPDMPRLKDPMFTTKPAGKGTGLGLYICQQIVSAHNGQLIISSKRGVGTQVTVQLPIAR